MATVQDELTAQEKLDTMLSDFDRRTLTDKMRPGKVLRYTLDSTPDLKATALRSVENGQLLKFDAEADPRFKGTFDYNDGTLRLSIEQLAEVDLDASSDELEQSANFVRYTVGHEIDHAISSDESLRLAVRFREQVAAIANGPSPHDYTIPVKSFNEGSREREARAEIAGFNAVAAHVKHVNPQATLRELYAADGGASNYIDEGDQTPPSYTLKPGLHIKPDLQLDVDKSLEAMAKAFYDSNPGYPTLNIDWAFGEIYRQEAAAQAAHPGRPLPEIRINVQELGAKVTVPPDFIDTSRPPADKAAPVTAPRSGLNANDPGHPDHALLEKIRDSVRGLEQSIGKPWDDRSERLSASALSLAVASKFGPGDDVKVALNRPTEQNAAGELLFVYRQGRNASPDPVANYAHMPVSQALSLSAPERYEQAATLRETQALDRQSTQETAQKTQALEGQPQTGPRMQH